MRKSIIAAIIVISLLMPVLTVGGCDKPENTTATSTGKPTEITTTTPTEILTVTPHALSATWCKSVIDSFNSIEIGQIPEQFKKEDATKTGGEFDVNEYLKVLTHLTMEPGYVLDYVYNYDGMGGGPILYVRPESQAPYKTYNEFAQDATAFQRPANDNSLIWLVMGETSGTGGNRIKLDGTNQGYFEYTVLQVLGAQFYLFWHANYNDASIVCDAADIESILQGLDNSGFGVKPSEGFKKAAMKINAQPAVEINGDIVTVQMVVFSKWGGFSRVAYTMYRNYPHTVIGFQEEVLLEYNCGVAF